MSPAQSIFLGIARRRAKCHPVSVVDLPVFNMDAVGLRLEKNGKVVDVIASGLECHLAKSMSELAHSRVDAAIDKLNAALTSEAPCQ